MLSDDDRPTARVLRLPSPAAMPEPVKFAPMPLLSGDAIDDAGIHPLESVTVVLTAADGTRWEVPLTYRHGGWWPPDSD